MQAIGVFDSGVGGLTVAKEIMEYLPNEKIIYIGDNLRCPYGTREQGEVKKFVLEIALHFLKFNIKLLVIACNTATAAAISELRNMLPIPVIGVIEPGVRAAIKISKNERIAVIATTSTINSFAYQKKFSELGKKAQVSYLACPKLVPLVESGHWPGSHAQAIVSECLEPLKDIQIDTLLLGCTHYPLLFSEIRKVMGKKVALVTSGEETALEVAQILDSLSVKKDENANRKHLFYTTGSPIIFKKIAEKWLKKEITSVYQLNL